MKKKQKKTEFQRIAQAVFFTSWYLLFCLMTVSGLFGDQETQNPSIFLSQQLDRRRLRFFKNPAAHLIQAILPDILNVGHHRRVDVLGLGAPRNFGAVGIVSKLPVRAVGHELVEDVRM